MELLQNPMSMLRHEADSIRAVIETIDGNIAELQKQIIDVRIQKASLALVAQAIDNEVERLCLECHPPEQLEFELDSL